ncbi:MAG: GNAT family N-acetyltransferase [Candidatus Izemoplasmataceae bacterium]
MEEIKKGPHMFYIGENETEAIAYIKYIPKKDNVIIANSTYVDPSLRGQQIAKKLLDRLALFAKEENLKIEPTCSYVVKAFERYSEYDEVKA